MFQLESLLNEKSNQGYPPPIEMRVIDDICRCWPTQVWMKKFFLATNVFEVEPLFSPLLTFCYAQFKHGRFSGDVLISMQCICQRLVWWACKEECKPTILLHSHGLQVFQSMQDMNYCLFTERDRLKFYPFTRLDTVVMDRSPKTFLGSGAFGKVYKMEFEKTKEPVAVKIIQYNDPESVANEITILSLLRHPNLIHLHGVMFQFDRDECLLVMELANCEIMDYLQKIHPPFKIKRSLILGLARAMEYLQAHQIIHRDIKAANVFIFGDNNNPIAKLGDLGCVHIATGKLAGAAGTKCYSAPEHISEMNSSYGFEVNIPTLASDIFQFGILLWEILCERHWTDYFCGSENVDWDEVRANAMTLLSSQHPAIPTYMINLITQCAHTIPSRRPTAAEIVKLIEEH